MVSVIRKFSSERHWHEMTEVVMVVVVLLKLLPRLSSWLLLSISSYRWRTARSEKEEAAPPVVMVVVLFVIEQS